MPNWKNLNEARWKSAKDKVKAQRGKDYDSFDTKDWGLVNHIYQNMSKSEDQPTEPKEEGASLSPSFPRGQKTKFDPAAAAKAYSPKQKQMFAHYTQNKGYSPLEAHALSTGSKDLHRFEEENPSQAFLKDIQPHAEHYNAIYHANKHAAEDRGAVNPILSSHGHHFLANREPIRELAEHAEKIKDLSPKERYLAALKAKREAFEKHKEKIAGAHDVGISNRQKNLAHTMINHNAIITGDSPVGMTAEPEQGGQDENKRVGDYFGHEWDQESGESPGYSTKTSGPHAEIASAPGMISRSQALLGHYAGKANKEDIIGAASKPSTSVEQLKIPEETRRMLGVYASHHADRLGRAMEHAERKGLDVDHDAAYKFLAQALKGYHKRPVTAEGKPSSFGAYLGSTLHHGLPSEHKMMTQHGKHIEDLKVDANKLKRESQAGQVKSLKGEELEAAKQKSQKVHEEKAAQQQAIRGQSPMAEQPKAEQPKVEPKKEAKAEPKATGRTPEQEAELKRLMGEQQSEMAQDKEQNVPTHMVERVQRAKKQKFTPEQIQRMLALEEEEKLGGMGYKPPKDEEPDSGEEPSYDPFSYKE